MRAPPLDLRLLEAFEAIYVEKSLTNAALKLSMTQPAVSQALTKMRAHFGDPLFVRTAAGMEPTPRAKELFVSVGVILREARVALVARPVFDPVNSGREFVIATTDLGAAALLPPLIEAVRQRAPQTRILSVNADAHDLNEELGAGDIALAIGNFPNLQSGIYCQGLYQETYVLLAHRERVAKSGGISLEQFCQARHVLVTAGNSGHFHGEVEKHLRALIRPELIVATVSSFLVAPLVARDNDLLVIVPQRVASIFAAMMSLEELPLPIELPAYPITQYWHARYHNDPGTVWMRRLVHELYSQSGPGGADSAVTLLAPDPAASVAE
ncbi:MAG: transcriptional regulator, LysR family [Betaproteobacteria bacterium]|nr:transcriptional regulator, LysR family [Betaproteobacteria bacterium]